MRSARSVLGNGEDRVQVLDGCLAAGAGHAGGSREGRGPSLRPPLGQRPVGSLGMQLLRAPR